MELTKPYLDDITLDIIIPMWNKSDYTINCIQSIRKNTELNYRIILIDNGSEVEETKAVVEVLAEKEDYIYQRNYKNLGFVKGVNIGIGLSTAEYLCFLNNDTEVPKRWANRMITDMEANGAWAVGPVSTSDHGWQSADTVFSKTAKGLKGEELEQFNQWAQEQNQPVQLMQWGSMVAFFCTIFKRSVIEKVGYLSEEYGIGFGDDDDYCMRMSKHGMRIAFTKNVVVFHNHRTTFHDVFGQDKRQQIQDYNLALYKNKWNL